MRVFGLTLKPLAQWPRHALTILSAWGLLASMWLSLRGMSLMQGNHEMMAPVVLLMQSLAPLSVIGLMHCMFLDPDAGPAAQLGQRQIMVRFAPPVAICLGLLIPFLSHQHACLVGSAIMALLAATIISQSLARLNQPGIENRLGVAAAGISTLLLLLSFLHAQWQQPLLPPEWMKAAIALSLMLWIAALCLRSAQRELTLRTSLNQFDQAARALHRIYNTSPVALLSLDAESRIQRWNQRAAEAFGGELNRQPPPLLSALLDEGTSQRLLADLKRTGTHHSEITLNRNGMERFWVLEASIRDGGGFELGMHEVTFHARRAITFQEIAEHDALTGLPNHVGLRHLLNRQLAQMRTSSPLSCIYINIREFNEINRLFGRQTGDAVLCATGKHLQKLMPPSATVGRVRDDQFMVILPGSELTQTRSQATTLLGTLARTPIEHHGMSITIDVDIGAVESVASINAERLIEAARFACELSRAEGAPRPYAVMADSPTLTDPEQLERFGQNLRNALPEQQIQLHAQAVTSLNQGIPVHSLTVLPRLLGENGQPQAANRLMQAAARQGASAALDRLLIARILQMLHTQPWTLPGNGVVIFRLSPLSLAEPGFTGNLIRMLGVQGDNRAMTINSRLCIELSSQSLDYDPEGSRAFLKDLRLMSVQSGIDLSDAEANEIPVRQLAQLPIRHVRLDGRQFADLNANPAAHKEIPAIRALYETLGIQVLVDQVNNPLDLRPLRELGIDLAQGAAVSAVRPLEHMLAGREEQSLLSVGSMIPV